MTGQSDIEVIFEDKNFFKEETAGFVISGYPKTLSGLNTMDSELAKCRAAMVLVVSVFKEKDSTFLTLSGGLVKTKS